MLGPFLVPAFFLASWITMIFWGIISPQVGVPTIGYGRAMLATLALWLVVFPVALAVKSPGFAARHKTRAAAADTSDSVKATAVFSAADRRIASHHFKGAEATAVFGGVRLDLRDAVVESKPAVIDVTAVFGGVEVFAPTDWRVDFETNAVFGGATDERPAGHPSPDGPPDLVITGNAVFGGVAVKG
jgi:hypothetical protein